MRTVLLLLLASLCGVAFTVVGVGVARRFLSSDARDGHNNVLAAVFQTGGTVCAVFLAFLVVAVWEAHDAAHANIAEEASLLSTLYRASRAMDPSSGSQLRALVRDYTNAVISDEWPVQARTGAASERARAAGLRMFVLLGRKSAERKISDASIDSAALNIMTAIQADRNKRTLQAGEGISGLIWAAAIMNGVLVVVMSFFLYTDRAWPHYAVCSVLASMIFMLLGVVYILERPFGGLMPLQPDAFRHSLEVYDSVDRTP